MVTAMNSFGLLLAHGLEINFDTLDRCHVSLYCVTLIGSGHPVNSHYSCHARIRWFQQSYRDSEFRLYMGSRAPENRILPHSVPGCFEIDLGF